MGVPLGERLRVGGSLAGLFVQAGYFAADGVLAQGWHQCVQNGGECGEKQSAGEGCGHEEVLEVVLTDCGGMGGKRLQKFVHR